MMKVLGSQIGVVVAAALSALSGFTQAQSPLWSNDLVTRQLPARNAVPQKDDPALYTDNGHDSKWQQDLRRLARIGDGQTDQDTGDPVSPVGGIVSYCVVDLFIPGRGLNFAFQRRYNSKCSDTDGPLGYGWDHCYDARLMGTGTGGAQVIVANGNDRQDKYTWTGTGSTIYNSPPGVYTLFKYIAPDTNILRNREGVRTYFVNGLLDRIQDPDGNTIRFYYDANSHLDYAVDTLGRTIDFSYNPQGRLEWIEDFIGRRVVYSYDPNGNLSGVQTPIVASTSGFNDFANGRTEHYVYLAGYNNLLDHKLSAVVRPNDVTQSNPPYGTPAVQFTYYTNPSLFSFGWCASQTLGGTNAAGTAGGTITYSYNVLDYQTPLTNTNAANIGRLNAHVINRRGLATDYVVNQNGQVIQVIDHNGAADLTTTNEYNADGELTKITQPNGNYTVITYATGLRLVAGNIATVTHYPGTITSDQASRTMSLEYEPIFGNLRLETDYLGNTTQYFTDYQEGRDHQGEANDVLPALQDELLGIYSRSFVDGLVSQYLTDQDLNGDGQQPLAKGNIIKIKHQNVLINNLGGAPLATLEGDFLQEACLTRTFNAYGQITSETDEEENVTVFLYYPESDPDGDGIPTAGSGLNSLTGGYQKRIVQDTTLPYSDPQLTGIASRNQGEDIGRESNRNPTPINKTTDYRYDRGGNVTSKTDPRGVRYEYSVNELNEVWRVRRATDVSAAPGRGGGIGGASEDLTGQAFAYDEMWKRDSNGNVVAHFVQNAGGWPDAVAAAGAPSSHFEEYWTFDILNDPRTETREYGFSGETATWLFGYDPNENRTSVTFPEGNAQYYTWDFRDQVSAVIRSSGPEASQTTFYHDGNGNLRQAIDGLGKSTVYEYDGYDRLKRSVQPVGTESKLSYDAQSNITGMSMWGYPGGSAPSGNDPAVTTANNIELQRFAYTYDARNRLTRVDRQDPQVALSDGTLSPNDGKVTTVFDIDRLNRTVYTVDDDSGRTEWLYDGASRRIKATDPVGNITETYYDDDDNAVKTIEKDVYPNSTYRSFETYRVFDSLNREASSTDNLGQTDRFTYDSRGNLVGRSDAVATLAAQYINGRQVNSAGNTTTIKVDGFGRVVLEESDLRIGGTGNGAIDAPTYNPDGRSTRTFTYDKNSRLRFATDDDGKTTEYQYDGLDRLHRVIYADGTQFTQEHDSNNNVSFWLDPVGSQATLSYDDKNRLTQIAAVPHAPAVGSTTLTYQYDGLDRLTKSTDSVDGTLGNGDDWVNQYTWDSLNRPRTQTQNNRTVTDSWAEEHKKTSVAYPSNTTVQYGYDALSRVTSVTQGTQLASYTYAGEDRLLQRSDAAQVVEKFHDGTGTWNDTSYYDGARRPIKQDFKVGAALLTGFEQGFDRANNRLYTRRIHDASSGDNFVYDSMYRLVSWERGVPAPSVGFPGGSSFDARLGFDLDGADSRRRTTRATGANQVPVPTVITVSDVHNYVTKQKGIGPQFTTWNQAFDLNGNKTAFTDQGAHPTYKYDFLNRLRVIQQGTQKVVSFDYDAEGRRVRTKVTGLSGYPATTEFVHDGGEVVEEYDGSGICLRRFYYGRKLDEFVAYDNLAYYPALGRYFYEQDSAGDVVAIHDTGGNVVERYTYGAFGSVFFETPANVEKTGKTQSDFGNPYLFRGLRYENYYDALYYVRARFLDCVDGNFIQRDPIGMWGDLGNRGNPKGYCGANPINRNDPLGKSWWSDLRSAVSNAVSAVKTWACEHPVIATVVAVAVVVGAGVGVAAIVAPEATGAALAGVANGVARAAGAVVRAAGSLLGGGEEGVPEGTPPPSGGGPELPGPSGPGPGIEGGAPGGEVPSPGEGVGEGGGSGIGEPSAGAGEQGPGVEAATPEAGNSAPNEGGTIEEGAAPAEDAASSGSAATEGEPGSDVDSGSEEPPDAGGTPQWPKDYRDPTNPPQDPPTNPPPGFRVKPDGKPWGPYKEGYWKLMKELPDGNEQPVDPRTLKPGPPWDTHVPFPPK